MESGEVQPWCSFDPLEDSKLHSGKALTPAELRQTPVRPLFLHANFPKFNPATIFETMSFGAAWTYSRFGRYSTSGLV